MEFLLLIAAFFLLRYVVTNKHSELKGKLNGVIFVPLFSLLLCYSLYRGGNELVNTLSNIDNLRYVSTYTSHLGSDVQAVAQLAQDYGYMSDEIISRSPDFEVAFVYSGFVNVLAVLAFIFCIVWIVNIGKLLFEYKNKKKSVTVSALLTLMALFLGAIFYWVGNSKVLNCLYGGNSNWLWLLLVIYLLVAAALIYWHYKSYRKLCLFLETNNSN